MIVQVVNKPPGNNYPEQANMNVENDLDNLTVHNLSDHATASVSFPI